MIRQTIKIDDYCYIADLYKANIDLDNSISSKFIMMRKFDLIDNVAYDTDIYFIDKTIFENTVDLRNGDIIYPQSNSNIPIFSNNFNNFNPDYTDEYIRTDVYELYERDSKHKLVEANVLCDKVRIYHPNNKVNLDAIIYFDNYINNIHFHYYCQKYSSHDSHSVTEFRENYNIYSEYIEILIPNIEDLFSKRIYYKEDINMIYNYKDPMVLEEKEQTEGDILTEKISSLTFLALENSEYNINGELVIDTWDSTYCSLFMFNIPFYVAKNNIGEYEKYYIPNVIKTIETNYISYPVNLTIYPYIYNEDTDLYYKSDSLTPNTDVFVSGAKFTLSTFFGFIDNKLALISNFNYPNSDKFKTFKDAYEYYNSVSFDEYIGIEYDEDDEEYIDDADNTQKQCGFEITIASDPGLKHKIYHDFLWDDTPDNFSFDLSSVFSSWEEMPDIIVCNTAFVDRYLGTTILGNFCVLTKEWYKYLVNDTKRYYRLFMDPNKFNFINTVKCYIKKEDKQADDRLVNKQSPTILYKPIFYRVSDLQNVQVRANLKQNIGVNLADYMTKVETFKIVFNDVTYIESARNDIFVIFNIDANAIGSSGTYNILNQDDEYISSGTWTLIQ